MTLETILPIPELFSARRILCIQPHYDDNDIAAAGILTQLAASGAELYYLTATDDLMGVVDTSLSDEEASQALKCQGPFQSGHPDQFVPITPDEELCGTCHNTTTDEWRASPHNQAGISCQECHNPHSQTSKADTVSNLCGNCHKERGESFTHGTHANSGLECSNCHMYTSPRTEDPIEGLVPTGHTFTVGSDARLGCHQDTVHTRDEIIKLSGEIAESKAVTVDQLEKTINEQGEKIDKLETSASVRLYTGLIQGAIVGLVTGGAAAWVRSASASR